MLEHIWLMEWGNRSNYTWLKEQFHRHQSFAFLWLQAREKGWKMTNINLVFEAVEQSLLERELLF